MAGRLRSRFPVRETRQEAFNLEFQRGNRCRKASIGTCNPATLSGSLRYRLAARQSGQEGFHFNFPCGKSCGKPSLSNSQRTIDTGSLPAQIAGWKTHPEGFHFGFPFRISRRKASRVVQHCRFCVTVVTHFASTTGGLYDLPDTAKCRKKPAYACSK